MYWSIGTTSFRVYNHLVKNKILLLTIKEFWTNHKNWDKSSEMDFYDLAKSKGIITGNAKRKDKDARQITSGLVDLGLLNKKRRITQIGELLLQDNNFKDKLFLIDNDNYIYLKQFLKLQINNLNPFVSLIYLLEKLNYLTYEEFTYLFQTCNNSIDVKDMCYKIEKVRNKSLDFDKTIISQIYKEERISIAIKKFSLINSPNMEDFVNLDMNRKSPKYSEPLKNIYNNLLYIKNNLNNLDLDCFLDLKHSIKKLSSNLYGIYNNYFFKGKRVESININFFANHFRKLAIMSANDYKLFNKEFGEFVHLAKWKSTLVDYADLNKRYFMLPGIVKFEDNKFELDILPKYIFRESIDYLIDNSIILDKNKYREILEKNLPISDICSEIGKDSDKLIKEIRIDYKEPKLNQNNISTFISDKRLERMNKLIDKYFMPDQLVKLLGYIDNRNDKALKGYADMELDVSPSTMYEYFSAIAWYHISGRKGNILDFMNLKLDANLLPLTHAPGFYSDIVFKYEKCNKYNEHDLLIEVTLSDSTGQRRMEMEPVSRHLVNYKNSTFKESYAIFIADSLNKMVLSDFRSRKSYFYEAKDEVRQGLKIIPLSTKDLCKILNKKYTYSDLYKLFDVAYHDSTCNDIEWYEKCVKQQL